MNLRKEDDLKQSQEKSKKSSKNKFFLSKLCWRIKNNESEPKSLIHYHILFFAKIKKSSLNGWVLEHIQRLSALYPILVENLFYCYFLLFILLLSSLSLSLSLFFPPIYLTISNISFLPHLIHFNVTLFSMFFLIGFYSTCLLKS